MNIHSCCRPPSSSLPPVRALRSASEDTIITALHNLQALYCPLRLPATLPTNKESATKQVDSGYVSEDDNEVTPPPQQQRRFSVTERENALAAIRADAYEKDFTIRWLTSLISRAYELPFDSEEAREKAVDDAAFILSSFSDSPTNEEDEALTRDFTFSRSNGDEVKIQINDAPLTGADHTDVGLQSWGASIVFSGLMCEAPERYGLDQLPEDASIIELGAGTGLVSLTLGKLLPAMGRKARILATDYHAAVLDNLRTNIATNFGDGAPVGTALLDWATPPAEHAGSANMLFAADVVYAPEHAAWLRDCAAHLLAPEGTFWLVVTVRSHGKFEGIPATAETAFEKYEGTRRPNGKVLRIMAKERLEKKRGVGRGDENGYMLFKSGWTEA
ncbi:hypothetical protein BU23DRAFT_560022 [Bimuria novae-zelandiae CBS 107.79]|uniref:S-adenosyl-L-methionine-dependent methyltransferase n=1 Tax=Bimuria novae-zelandiae CBS 107.79 TaxID=1447943 RepID=A0A6A5URK6_9PLEO|nr:hypothetical protein BU23DRAFT_560022 [Bimuria novae-zelandiae CBS 107.79]